MRPCHILALAWSSGPRGYIPLSHLLWLAPIPWSSSCLLVPRSSFRPLCVIGSRRGPCRLYVNPQMVMNTEWKPESLNQFFCLPPRFYMGSPHLQHIIVTILAPCFYMERLAHLCFHTGTVHCQRVIQNKCIPVSIRVFPYGNGDWHITIWKRLPNHRFHMGIEKFRLPVPYGNLRMETGIDGSPFHLGTMQSLTYFHMVSVTIWEFRK